MAIAKISLYCILKLVFIGIVLFQAKRSNDSRFMRKLAEHSYRKNCVVGKLYFAKQTIQLTRFLLHVKLLLTATSHRI